jgi:ADP-heptose:LPS heptosyltransferase
MDPIAIKSQEETVNNDLLHVSLAKAKTMLIVRPDNLGDAVLFSGALKPIRERWPGAKITLCVKRFVTGYFELCPYIDDILVWEDVSSFLCLNYREKLRSVTHATEGRLIAADLSSLLSLSYRGILRNLTHPSLGQPLSSVGGVAFDLFMKSGLSFDVVLFPVRSPAWYHHLFVKAVSASAKFGISGDFCNQTPQSDRAASKIYTARLNIPEEDRWENELLFHARFLGSLGIATERDGLWPTTWTDPSDGLWALRAMDPIMTPDCVCLGISAGGNAAMTKYAPERLAEAISILTDVTFNCVILGSYSDLSVSGSVEQSLTSCGNVVSTLNLTGRTSIRQMIECLKLCDIILAIESAPLHIATALRKPTVGIMGGGHFGRFYPWGDPGINRVAHNPMDCYFCNWRCSNGHGRCIQEISPSVVARELGRLVENLERQ